MGGRVSQLVVMTATAFTAGVYIWEPQIKRGCASRRDRKLEELKQLEQDPTINVEEDVQVLKLKREIAQLTEVVETSSMWALWVKRKGLRGAREEETKATEAKVETE
eukprot:TRINITY_DN16103_c0_g1_i1.p1 TRINITY_DN16103_c0_g1~~TRINITY_DN16103_c0_g1_i1.p1  ORF type:complete len:107 (-),score=35.32 TRINITY_DN16103_c0_g1_i1:15-335(-)